MPRFERRMSGGIGALVLAAQCSGGALEPVAIVWNEDACNQCRMAISQQEFAAEIVTGGGAVYSFDDIGCMAHWTMENELPENTAWFVTDYDTQAWLDAKTAYYVRSSQLPTPMSYGLAAFQTRAQAEAAAKRLEGEVIEWATVLQGGS